MPEESQDFYRIQKLPPYVFAVINEMRAKARRRRSTSSIWGWEPGRRDTARGGQ